MKVFITGMTGTLGTALAKFHRQKGDEVFGCARDEDRCLRWCMENKISGAKLVIGCCRELMDSTSDVQKAFIGSDRLYHCAALKHVDLCEENPGQAMVMNVLNTEVVIAACHIRKVPMVFASTDKALKPSGVYGATKLIAERLVLQEGGTVVRFGNLIGSSGSVFKLWAEAVRRGEPIKLTDPNMTRFFLPVQQAASFMVGLTGPNIFWPKMKAARMGDVALALSGPFDAAPYAYDVIGIRPGETLHQEISDGVSSETAERWNIEELLKEAGITQSLQEQS